MTSSTVRSRVRELAEQALDAIPTDRSKNFQEFGVKAVESAIDQALREFADGPMPQVEITPGEWSMNRLWLAMARQRLSEMGVEPKRGGNDFG